MLCALLQDRAKVITRRRPPSRKARRTAALSASISFDDTSSPTSPDLPPIADLETGSQPKKASDLFGNDDLFAEGSSAKTSVPSTESSHQSDNLFSKGLFGSSTAKTNPEPKTSSDKVDGGDLFGSSNARSKAAQKEEDIFGDSKAKKPLAGEDVFNAAEAALKADTRKGHDKAPSKDEDEDDLFSSGPVSKKDSSSKGATLENSSSKSSAASSATSSGSKPSKAAEADDDDDIFADSSLNKKKGMKL